MTLTYLYVWNIIVDNGLLPSSRVPLVRYTRKLRADNSYGFTNQLEHLQ